MTSSDASLTATPGIVPSERTTRGEWMARWPMAVALLVLALPTIATLGQQVWSTEAGAHAPIVLATALWLLIRDGEPLHVAARTNTALVVLGLAIALPIYVFGRGYDFISVETAGLYLAFLTIFYAVFGGHTVRAQLFPLLYLGFIIPLPGWFVLAVTQPLQTLLSSSSTLLLQAFDYPIAQQGVSLFIGPYQLLVEDACAGMNSLVGLIAISLFYIYITHRASLRYAAVLLLLIVPVAILVNFIRIVILILVTYHFGDAAAQGFLHVTTGLVMFLLGVLIIFAADQAIMAVLERRRARHVA